MCHSELGQITLDDLDSSDSSSIGLVEGECNDIFRETLGVNDDQLTGLFQRNFEPGRTIDGCCSFGINFTDTEMSPYEPSQNACRAMKPFFMNSSRP